MQNLSASISRIFPVAVVSLGLAWASPVAAAAMTEAERCAWKADKAETRYAKCLARASTRLVNVLSGSTQDDDDHCAEQFSRSMDILERRASFRDVGAECLARVSEAGQNAAQAETLVGAGRDLADYPDLSVSDLADSPIGDYLDQSYDTGYDAGYGDGEASVPASSYNCFIGGFCAQAAITYPSPQFGTTNVYEGHTQGTEPALGAGCNSSPGSVLWAWGRTSVSLMGGPTYSTLISTKCASN